MMCQFNKTNRAPNAVRILILIVYIQYTHTVRSLTARKCRFQKVAMNTKSMLQAPHKTYVLISLSAVERTGILWVWYKAHWKSMDWLHIAFTSTHPDLNHQTLCVRTWKYVLFYPLATKKLIPSYVSNSSPLSSFFLLLVHLCHCVEAMDGTQRGRLLRESPQQQTEVQSSDFLFRL